MVQKKYEKTEQRDELDLEAVIYEHIGAKQHSGNEKKMKTLDYNTREVVLYERELSCSEEETRFSGQRPPRLEDVGAY